MAYEQVLPNLRKRHPDCPDAGQLPSVMRVGNEKQASFTVPNGRVMPPGTGTMHIILAVTDHGAPQLTRYGRVIVTVNQ